MRLITTWSFGLRCAQHPWQLLCAGGAALDAVEATCVAAESDPAIDSVGFGGLPDREGRVTLDGCVMLSPRRCGSVCAVTITPHPVAVARRVMERTPHVMLAGPGADAFAAEQGLARPDQPLLAPGAEAAWREWRREGRVPDQSKDRNATGGAAGARSLRPIDGGLLSSGSLFSASAGAESSSDSVGSHVAAPPPGLDAPDPNRHHDTIGVLALDSAGVLAGACSTSGTPYKLPGRVGDSPIIGHGLYVDPRVGAASATGAGELIMGVCGSFAVVERIRQGKDPRSAIEEVLHRIAADGEVQPHQQVAFIALAVDGRWASGALKSGYKTTIFAGGSGAKGSIAEPDVVLRPD